MDLEGNREIQAKKNALYLAVILLLCLTITVGCYFFIKDNGNGLYIKRDEWTSVVSIGRPFLDHPVKKVVLYFEPAYRCETREECLDLMRFIQNTNMREMRWPDIGHSFIVGGDGDIYEGRGWDVQPIDAKGYIADCISIVFTGWFEDKEKEEEQVKAVKRLLKEGLHLNKLHSDYEFEVKFSCYGCPENNLDEMKKHWPYWSKHPDILRN